MPATLPFDRYDCLPATLADIGPRDVRRVFPRPALVEIAGVQERPLFVSTLLHGNETTSYFVLQALAERYAAAPPPRSLIIFIGNVEAAEAGLRHLPGAPDFNRVWAGPGSGKRHAAHDLVAAVTAEARAANPFASIDIHNNSGRNPYYGCVNALRPADRHLAALFSDICVYYRNPPTTQSIAFEPFCPAITIECGQSGDADGIERAIALVERAMRLEDFPDAPPDGGAQRLYETVGAIVIDPAASISFGEPGGDIVLRADIETLNFADLAPGEIWAPSIRDAHALCVVDEHGDAITERFLEPRNGGLAITGPITPAMLTRDPAIIRSDCLGYFMRRL